MNPEASVGWPTPDELVERLRRLGAGGAEIQQAMASAVRDAETGGPEHMEAVAGFIASLPPAPPDPKASRYDAQTGRPTFHESNILIELRVRVNGRLFTCREAVDPFMFETRFAAGEEFEKYIEYFVRASCGRMATDPDAYRYFRALVRVIHPRDPHDFKRCADGWKATPRCDLGIITRAPIVTAWVPDAAVGPLDDRDDALGVCPCRCHRFDGSGARSGPLARMYGLPQFDEDRLDENGWLL